jgi:hypothetical protein
MPQHAAGYNRVLAALPFMKGSLLRHQVDLADVDETYRRGDHVVTLMLNTDVFHDEDGRLDVYAVSVYDAVDVTVYVAVFDSLDAAQVEFAKHIEP